jgi:RecA/RadA recombinase
MLLASGVSAPLPVCADPPPDTHTRTRPAHPTDASSARTPSGCLTLDRALGGGYPRGRIVEIFGPEASGKTTLALHAIAEVQKVSVWMC